ncbi:hypothetical protein GCM10010096_00420 [Alcaligenes pakistanensis]|uniref:Uncharacterized protein n=1 Tax=Alcaligenes pakistanensis TaxID=1482717 RepID=A0A8H9IFF9_9BURK|nr:hypothetical protein GCM10010096_00420 [Alcaligenes pakistanensis]
MPAKGKETRPDSLPALVRRIRKLTRPISIPPFSRAFRWLAADRAGLCLFKQAFGEISCWTKPPPSCG